MGKDKIELKTKEGLNKYCDTEIVPRDDIVSAMGMGCVCNQ